MIMMYATHAIYRQCMEQRYRICSLTFVRWMEDIYIVPSLTGYGMMSYDVESVPCTADGHTLIPNDIHIW